MARDQGSPRVLHHMKFTPNMRESTLKRFLRQENFEEHLELHRIDCLSSHGWLDAYHFARRRLSELPSEQLRPKSLITGDDLIQVGYRPGPAFSAMLRAVEDAQLEARIQDKEEALALVREVFGPP